MAISNFIPQIWSARLQEKLQHALVFGTLCNRSYEGDIRQWGDTVHINTINDITVKPYDPAVAIDEPEQLSGTDTILTIDHGAYYNFMLNDVDAVQARADVLDAAMKKDQILFLAPQKRIDEDDPHLTGLYPIGCVAQIKQVLKSQGDNIRVLVTGLYRGKITQMHYTEPYLCGSVERVSEIQVAETLRTRAMRRDANALYSNYLELAERPSQSVQLRMLTSEDKRYGVTYKEDKETVVNAVRRLTEEGRYE